MQTVSLKPLFHRSKEQIAIYYPNDNNINRAVRKLKDVRWSQTHRCWYVPLSELSYKLIAESLATVAIVDSTSLGYYLQKKKEVAKTEVFSSGASVPSKAANNPAASPAWKLSSENREALQKFVEQLKLKAYSPSTIRTYRNEFLQLLGVLNKKPVHGLTTDDLRRYFVYCFEKLHLSENTLHSRINALYPVGYKN